MGQDLYKAKGQELDNKENESILDVLADCGAVLHSKHNSVITCQRKQEILNEICERVNFLCVANRTSIK